MKAAASLATEKANKADAAFEMASFKIGPRQFLGLEINRRAVAIAQLVLWIGFFQWQRKTTGKADTNERPLLPKEASIVQQNAVLAYDAAVLEAYGWSDLTTRDTNKEAPHSCGAGACLAIAKREALPNEVPFAPPQECGGSADK